MTGLLGGAFDPPHLGHVALLRDARAHFGFDRVAVLVVADPGHKHVGTPPETRLDLARAAFPGEDVELDPHARTVETLRARWFDDPVFLIGADQFADFFSWTEPDEVLELARLGVATRPGFSRGRLEGVLVQLAHPERVEFFDIEPFEIASSAIRDRVARGEPIFELVPEPVAAEIERLGLYRGSGGHR